MIEKVDFPAVKGANDLNFGHAGLFCQFPFSGAHERLPLIETTAYGKPEAHIVISVREIPTFEK